MACVSIYNPFPTGKGPFTSPAIRLISVLLLLAITPGILRAQTPQTNKRNRIGAWREEPGRADSGIPARVNNALDRAIGRINVSRLDHRTHNFGDMGTTADGWHTSRYPAPDGSLDSWGYNMSMALAVGPGPWFSSAQVHESTGDFQSLSRADWEAMDGARGTQFSNPQPIGGYPQFAHSNLPHTWPPSGWPAPEAIIDIWLGTEIWQKWERCADQEAFCWFDDSHAGRNIHSSVLDISVRKRILGFKTFDAVFFQFELTNNSSFDYTPVFIGAFGDLGSPVYNSWTGFPRYDPSRQMHYNVGADYDSSSGTHEDDEGEICSWFGFMWLESPTGSFKKDPSGNLVDNPDRVRTRLALTHWGDAIYEEDERLYSALTADTQYLSTTEAQRIWKADANGGNPVLIQNEEDWRKVYNSADADHYVYSASGPITFRAGEKIDFVVCVVAGNSEHALKGAADEALRYYQARFRASGPPPAPVLSCSGLRAGPDGREFNPDIHRYRIHYTDSGSVALTWDGQESETTPDRNTGVIDFEGYKIYKSMDRGLTWGEPVTDIRGSRIGYVPVAQFDLDNSVEGEYPLNRFWLGENTGLAHSWIDTDVMDGFEYWYLITSYDYAPPDSVLESSMGGDIVSSVSIVAAVPGSRPAGWVDGTLVMGAMAGNTIDLLAPDNDYETSISVVLIDQSAITGDSYSVTVTGNGWYGRTNYPYLGGIEVRNTTQSTYPVIDSRLPNSSIYGNDLLPVVDGFRVVTVQSNGGDGGVFSLTQTTDVTPDSTYSLNFSEAYMEGSGPASNRANRTGFMNTLEYRFTGLVNASGDTNRAIDYYEKKIISCPYELWDVETGTRIWPVVYEFEGGGRWVSDDYNVATPVPYDQDFLVLHPPGDVEYWSYDTSNPVSRSDWVYRWAFDEYDLNDAGWEVGDVWTLVPFKVLKGYAGQTYSFSTTAPAIEDTLIDYDDIRVVPNPYYVHAGWDQSINRRMVHFTNVPVDGTIDIYTLTGELVASLDHSGSALDEVGTRGYNSDRIGTVVWNLWTYEFIETAFGLYIYVVKVGNQVRKIGKFAIIR